MFASLSSALAASQTAQLHEHDVFSLHPRQVYAYTEAISEAWRVSPVKRPSPTAAPGDPGIGGVDSNGKLRAPLRTMFEVLEPPGIPSQRTQGGTITNTEVIDAVERVIKEMFTPTSDRFAARPWYHVSYAYLVENTRILDMAERLLRDALHSERLGVLSDASYRWLHATEALFFKPGESPLLSTITSTVRPVPGATFRNLYYRMLGFDLTHGASDGGLYPYEKPEVANRSFGKVFEHFLSEVWKGYIHATNQSGPKTTDDAVILDDINCLGQMLRDRRQSGQRTLAREEFVAVMTMSWFHLTVSADDAPIVHDLKASATTPEERLHLLGKRVGVPTHANAGSLFMLAGRVAMLLTMIEENRFTTGNVNTLYTLSVNGSIAPMMLEIINHWSKATSSNLKSVPVAMAAAV